MRLENAIKNIETLLEIEKDYTYDLPTLHEWFDVLAYETSKKMKSYRDFTLVENMACEIRNSLAATKKDNLQKLIKILESKPNIGKKEQPYRFWRKDYIELLKLEPQKQTSEYVYSVLNQDIKSYVKEIINCTKSDNPRQKSIKQSIIDGFSEFYKYAPPQKVRKCLAGNGGLYLGVHEDGLFLKQSAFLIKKKLAQDGIYYIKHTGIW